MPFPLRETVLSSDFFFFLFRTNYLFKREIFNRNFIPSVWRLWHASNRFLYLMVEKKGSQQAILNTQYFSSSYYQLSFKYGIPRPYLGNIRIPNTPLALSFTFQKNPFWGVCVLNHVWLFVTPWTVAHQVPLPVECSGQESWGGLPFPIPGDLPNPGLKPVSLTSPALPDRLFTTSPVCCHFKEPIWKAGIFRDGNLC